MGGGERRDERGARSGFATPTEKVDAFSIIWVSGEGRRREGVARWGEERGGVKGAFGLNSPHPWTRWTGEWERRGAAEIHRRTLSPHLPLYVKGLGVRKEEERRRGELRTAVEPFLRTCACRAWRMADRRGRCRTWRRRGGEGRCS